MMPATYISRLIHKPNSRGEQAGLFDVIDKPLLGVALFLLFLGLIMVGSASTSVAEKLMNDPFYFFWRQLAYMFIGLVAAAITLRIPMEVWEKSGLSLVVISTL
ncbi:MAG: FtsW/RodA/SpoVE family cell cycle protein, partial [Thiohalophilus sp.]